MKIRYLLALALLFSLLAFGQVGCLSTGGKASVIGLDFSLLPEAPPSVIEPGIEFQVISKIENYGNILASGELCVEDTIDDAYGGIGKNCQFFSIAAASEENGNILPKSEIVYFPSASSSFSYSGIESQPTSIIASLIYGYSTEAAPIFCVKDPLKESAVSCSNSETKTVNVKAPLGITKVEKNIFRVSDNQIRLNVKIYLKKQVSGTLLMPGAVSGFNEGYENRVLLREVSFGPNLLNCEAEGNIIDISTEKILRCTGVINVNGVIEHPLKIKLDYSVETKKVYPLKIEKQF